MFNTVYAVCHSRAQQNKIERATKHTRNQCLSIYLGFRFENMKHFSEEDGWPSWQGPLPSLTLWWTHKTLNFLSRVSLSGMRRNPLPENELRIMTLWQHFNWLQLTHLIGWVPIGNSRGLCNLRYRHFQRVNSHPESMHSSSLYIPGKWLNL